MDNQEENLNQNMPPEEPVAPPPLPPRHSSKLFIGLIVFFALLLMAGIAFGAYYFSADKNSNSTKIATIVTPTPTPDPASNAADATANWKTYTNDTFSYSLKFPDTFTVPVQTSREKSQLGVDNNMCIKNKSDNNCHIIINVYSISTGATLQQWIDDNKLLAYGTIQTRSSTGLKINLNGNDGFILESFNGGNNYIFQHNNDIYVLELPKNYTEEDKEILSTFKFIDTTNTSNWKTYEGKNFTFKYPPELELTDAGSMIQIADKGLPPLDGNCTNIHIYPPSSEQINEGWILENRKSLKPDNTTSTPIVHQYTNSFDSLIKGYWFEKGSESIGKYIFANINGKYIEVGFPGCGAGDNYSAHPEVLEIMDQILSTFTFVDSN
ncbi:MAG: hypothetical protein WD992_00020 [Candidatus Levyibacteriota bacterium]